DVQRDRRVARRVDARDADGGGRCRRRGCEHCGAGRDRRESTLHSKAPSKLADEKAERGATPLRSSLKKLGGRTTPFAASFSRNCGFRPVQSSEESRRVVPLLG